jgi:hypothetical protein
MSKRICFLKDLIRFVNYQKHFQNLFYQIKKNTILYKNGILLLIIIIKVCNYNHDFLEEMKMIKT